MSGHPYASSDRTVVLLPGNAIRVYLTTDHKVMVCRRSHRQTVHAGHLKAASCVRNVSNHKGFWAMERGRREETISCQGSKIFHCNKRVLAEGPSWVMVKGHAKWLDVRSGAVPPEGLQHVPPLSIKIIKKYLMGGEFLLGGSALSFALSPFCFASDQSNLVLHCASRH